MASMTGDEEDFDFPGILNPWWTIRYLGEALPLGNKRMAINGLLGVLSHSDPDEGLLPIQIADILLQYGVRGRYDFVGCGEDDCEACSDLCDEDHEEDPITEEEVADFTATLHYGGDDMIQLLTDFLKNPDSNDEEEN